MRPVMLWTTIEDIFEVTGRGCFVVPSPSDLDFRVRVKDRLQLRTPGGVTLNTHITAVEIACGTGPCRMAIGLPRDLKSSDIPAGTEILVVEQTGT